MMTLEFAGPGTRLAPGDIDAEAADLRCEPAVIIAVCDVEAGKSGFLPSGKPKILYEAHVFGRRTNHQWDDSNPNVSAPRWDRSLYGASGEHQYERLAEAMDLDRTAALEATSWGMFQVLGLNAGLCGYKRPEGNKQVADVEAFVAAMVTGERAHLDAFTKFCIANRIDDDLRATPPRFEEFTRVYNGPGQVERYSTLLAAAWRKALANPGASPNPQPRTDPVQHNKLLMLNSQGTAVAALQKRLEVRVDSDFGPATMAAVVGFQTERGLVPDGIVGKATRDALAGAQRQASQPDETTPIEPPPPPPTAAPIVAPWWGRFIPW